jgi:hypothetical protein
MFALEAIKAKHGDCLLLHWGTANDPKLALIDGGPNRVYPDFLKPRLMQLASERGQQRLKLDLTMVSHIDDDHIAGLLDLAEDIENEEAPVEIDLLWHNSLEGLLDNKIEGPSSSVTAMVGRGFPGMDRSNQWSQKVLASVPQGQELHAFAKRMNLQDRMNEPYQPLILAGVDPPHAEIEGLSLTVVCPAVAEVEKLRDKWIKFRKEGILADYNDRSPYNLSSIVVLAKYDDKRMLLTGDGRGDLILEGLETLNLLTNGSLHVQLLKLPHHGSNNNVEEEFFRRVTADAYVVSGDHERFPNPNEEAMHWLKNARGGANYTVYCTYDLSYMRTIFGDRLRVPDGKNVSITAKIA